MLKKVFSVLLLSISFSAFAFAAADVGPSNSSGGTDGTTKVRGHLAVIQGGIIYEDHAQASTNSNSLGTVGAMAVIHWATSSNGDLTDSDYEINNNSLSASTEVYADNNYGTYATGGHTYSSTAYGSYSGSTQLNF